MARFTLEDLEAAIAERAAAGDPKDSYTARLLDAGVGRCAKKFGEEAVEAVIAAVAEDRDALASEAGDVLYHLMVMLRARDVSLDEVLVKLAERRGFSGLEEKAARARKPEERG